MVKKLKWNLVLMSVLYLGLDPLLIIFQLSGFAAVIVWYIILSLLTYKK